LEPQKVDAGVTEGAVFDCAAEGIPAPQIQWYINGKTLDSKSLFDQLKEVIHSCLD